MNTENEKKENLPGFRETLDATLRACKIWHRRNPRLLPSLVLYCFFSAVTPYVTIYFSSQILNELAGGRDLRRLGLLVGLTIGLTALCGAATALCNRWQQANRQALYLENKQVETEKMLSLDYQAADDPHTHQLLKRMWEYRNWHGYGLTYPVLCGEKLLQSLFGIVGALSLTVSLFLQQVPQESSLRWLNNPLVTLLALAVLLGVTFLSPLLQGWCNQIIVWVSQAMLDLNRFFNFLYGNMQSKSRSVDVRMYRQDRLIEHYALQDKTFQPSSPLTQALKGKAGLLVGASAAVSGVFTGLAYAFVCLKAWAGAFAVGSVAQYVGAITGLSGNIVTLAEEWNGMRTNAVYLRTAFQFLDIPNPMYQGSLTTEKRSDGQYEIEFRDVSFRYPNTQAWALRHVSLTFQVGRRMAVVGENGSGKTTFIKLLCRLYDPTEGTILLNGIDIRKYDYREYLALFSVVFQDFQLLGFPLGENVAAAVQYQSRQVEECLREAGFGKRLDNLPQGLETCLSREFDENGVELSGGEAQKVALARALYKNAPFVVLDEPTAALDPIAEMEVYQNFDRMMGGKTAVYISHRLSSCRFCDHIAVFDRGRMVQQGSHDSLLQAQGKYRDLWYAQAQYYAEKKG